jgi:alpha-D-ribose 1-methylphosphonate 5-triphosphate synthase subunit PhnL
VRYHVENKEREIVTEFLCLLACLRDPAAVLCSHNAHTIVSAVREAKEELTLRAEEE